MLADLYSMADYSAIIRAITIRFLGGYWARRQLHAGKRYVSTRSILMELQGWRFQILDGRFLHGR